MKRTLAVLTAFAAVATLAACDDPEPMDEMAAPPVETMPDAIAADDAGAETAAPAADTPPAPDAGALPADKRSSEESVQPESETLFY